VYLRAGEATGRSGDLFPFAGRALPGGGLPRRGGDVYLGAGEAMGVVGPGQRAAARLRAVSAAVAYSSPPTSERLQRSAGAHQPGSEVLLRAGAGTNKVTCQAGDLFTFAGTEATCTSGPEEATGTMA
jgi:hypothetical protein